MHHTYAPSAVDRSNAQKVGRLAASDGSVLREWGSFGDGNCQFGALSGVAVDSAGNVLVSICTTTPFVAVLGGGHVSSATGWPSTCSMCFQQGRVHLSPIGDAPGCT